MGGKGSGGTRPGAGRPPRLTGLPRPAQPAAADSAAQSVAPAAAEVAKPAGLPKAVSAAWDRLALEAVAAGTLTARNVRDFEVYCWLDVELRRACRKLAGARVGSDEWKALVKGVATLTQRHEIKARNFTLAPVGKPLVKVGNEKPKSALDLIKERRQGFHAVR